MLVCIEERIQKEERLVFVLTQHSTFPCLISRFDVSMFRPCTMSESSISRVVITICDELTLLSAPSSVEILIRNG